MATATADISSPMPSTTAPDPTMRRFGYDTVEERDHIRDIYRRAYGAELIDVPNAEDAMYAQWLRQLYADGGMVHATS